MAQRPRPAHGLALRDICTTADHSTGAGCPPSKTVMSPSCALASRACTWQRSLYPSPVHLRYHTPYVHPSLVHSSRASLRTDRPCVARLPSLPVRRALSRRLPVGRSRERRRIPSGMRLQACLASLRDCLSRNHRANHRLPSLARKYVRLRPAGPQLHHDTHLHTSSRAPYIIITSIRSIACLIIRHAVILPSSPQCPVFPMHIPRHPTGPAAESIRPPFLVPSVVCGQDA